MPVIALTQEMGSLAKDVAEQLAQTLNISTMKHEVAEHVAQRMQVPKSLVTRFREGKAGMIERLRADTTSINVFAAEDVLAAAAKGDKVLRGWGATCLLRPVSHVVCVRVTRSMPRRVEWLMAQLGIKDADMAEEEIRRSDKAHAARMHDQFGVTWGDPLLYDLVLNTDRLSVDSCVGQIRALAARPEFQETDASRAVLEDLALTARVRSALRAHEATREVDIHIQACGGKVVLGGLVLRDAERAAVKRVAAAVEGVTEVKNQVRAMKPTRKFTYSKT